MTVDLGHSLSSQTTPHRPLKYQPLTRPCYGLHSSAESGAFDEEEYYDEDEEELEEEVAKLIEDYYDSNSSSLLFLALIPTFIVMPKRRPKLSSPVLSRAPNMAKLRRLVKPTRQSDRRLNVAEEEESDEIMTDTWPSATPNRLGDVREGQSVPPNDPRLSCLGLPLALPYEVETLADMDDRLEHIVCKLVECVKAREWGLGFRMWDSALSIWMSMGYPMKKEVKIKLIFLFYEILFVPGLSATFVEDAGNQYIGLISDRNLNIFDFRVPWRPLYDALYQELFPHPNKLSRHSVNLAPMFLNVAESSQRFFHPGDVDEMLEIMLPRFEPGMDSILATQTFLVHFLPISHCDKWLPLIFRLWYGFNSGLWDDQASDLMGQLSIAHVDPARSDPSVVNRIPRAQFNTPEEEASNPNHKRTARGHQARLLDVAGEVIEDDDGVNYWSKPELMPEEPVTSDPNWGGIRKDIGIFTEQEFEFLMSKCLRSLNVPVGGSLAASNAMSVTMSDTRASKKILDAKKPIDRVQSLAETIIFCMCEDAPAASTSSGTATPLPGSATPLPAAVTRLQNGLAMKKSGSSDSLAAAGKKGEENKKYLGGSKALDHLSRLLTSCETFFHPSNSGHWTSFLTVFLSHLAGNFIERFKSEAEPTCKTPEAWRLTPEIKRQFVLCLRPLALTSMFNKDMESVSPAIAALKKLALLEPDLIMPALMERAVPSLQGLEETQRTPAVTYALASLAQPLAGRQVWRIGGMYVGDIFNLLLPGIDLNDPSKTGLSCMAISNMVDFIRLGDISEIEGIEDVTPGARALRKAPRIHVEDDPNDPASQEMEALSAEEVDERVRLGTSFFRDWVTDFLGRVFLLFSNLPEEGGKSGRAGGKTEALTLQSVLHTCGGVFAALDDKLYDMVLDQIYEFITTTCRANAVDAVGELVRNIASANAPKTFAKIFPTCRQRIITELKAGASSLRTQTTSIPRASDATLHWWQSILYGMLIPGRVRLSSGEAKAQYVDLLRIMTTSTLSERGWAWTGKIVEKSVSCLTSIYFTEMKMLNQDDYASEDFRLNHTLWWGKMYRATEVKPEWRTPSAEDIDTAFDILGIADECTTKLNELVDKRSVGDNVWSNEFCRSINVIDKVLRGSYNLIAEIESRKTGGKQAETYLPAAMLQLPKAYKSGLLLTQDDDPRYEKVLAIRQRMGEALHRAASAMRDAGESDNSVEAVRLLVSTIGTLLTAYGIRSKQFSNAQNAYSGMMSSKKMYEGQRKHHRSIFMAAASIHHQNRLTTLAYYRVRSELDDKLIGNMLDFCLSPFTRIRRASQTTLETIAKVYRGVWVLCFPTLFDALQPGSDPDRMKGALYVLRYNHVGLSRISRDWKQLLPLVQCLLNAHHENKASVQALVSKATEELISHLKEPESFHLEVGLQGVDKAADEMADVLQVKPDRDLVKRLNDGLLAKTKLQDEKWNEFVAQVIQLSKNPSLNWRYSLWASKLLYNVMRKDRPTDVRLAAFFADQVRNAHPRLRDYGILGSSRQLYQVALRSLCEGSEERLFIQEPYDRLTTEIELKDTSKEFTQQYLQSFREPLPKDESNVMLQDRLQSGWLVWGKTLEMTRLTGWDEVPWQVDPACADGIKVFEDLIKSDGFWRQVADRWAQEDARNYPSATHIDFILSLAQLFGPVVWESTRSIIEGYHQEMESTKVYDRHKMRAMWELLAGLLRGSEEWTGKDRKAFWEWLTPLLPELYGNIRHDTTKCWDISLEYVLNEKDPRRFAPLLDFCLSTALNADFNSASAFDLSRSVQLVRSIIRCLQWRFNAWADDFAVLYFKAIACPYAEVRGLMASVLNALDQLKFYPSYPNAAALTNDILGDLNSEKDIMHIKAGDFMPQLQHIMDSLPEWKKERPHGPKAVLSTHDTAAATALNWLSIELSDVHAVGTFPYLIPMLPAIFELRDLNDNNDLQRVAGRLLAMITSITPSLDLIDPLMSALISILQDSPSWRTKMHSMPVLSLVYFRNLSLLSEPCKAKCLDVVSACLRDSNQEVREMASTTLSGFLRCSQRAMVVVLKDRFTREIRSITLPRRREAPGQINPEYQAKAVELHGAILGVTAIVEAFPYTVPKFMPKLLADVLAPRVSEPAPISDTIRACVASFKRTHEKYQDKFSEDELSQMNYAQAGNSYYA